MSYWQWISTLIPTWISTFSYRASAKGECGVRGRWLCGVTVPYCSRCAPSQSMTRPTRRDEMVPAAAWWWSLCYLRRRVKSVAWDMSTSSWLAPFDRNVIVCRRYIVGRLPHCARAELREFRSAGNPPFRPPPWPYTAAYAVLAFMRHRHSFVQTL